MLITCLPSTRFNARKLDSQWYSSQFCIQVSVAVHPYHKNTSCGWRFNSFHATHEISWSEAFALPVWVYLTFELIETKRVLPFLNSSFLKHKLIISYKKI